MSNQVKPDDSMSAEDIDNLAQNAHEKHILNMRILHQLAKLNELHAQKDKIKELIKADRSELILINHEMQMEILESNLELRRKESELCRATYELEIELPAQLEIEKIRRVTEAKVERVRVETNASQVFTIRELGLARIKGETSCSLAQAKSLNELANALNNYYKALIVDRIAGYILGILSRQFQVDPSFRLKLEKPISPLVSLAETANLWKQVGACKKKMKNRRRQRVEDIHNCVT